MRDAFFAELLSVFSGDDRIVFLTGDLGYKLYDPLKAVAPDRVINFGIREAGMIGFAAGLAGAGMLPVVYSIVPFITLRCLEQIKLELCYNRHCVFLVGVGGGYAYGKNGTTHHGIEDIGLMRTMVGMQVFTPCDPLEVRGCVRAIPNLGGPAYLRLGRNGEQCFHRESETFSLEEPFYIPNRRQGLILTNGFLLTEVTAAVESLKAEGLFPSVVHLPCIEPLPKASLGPLLAEAGPVLIVEEHVQAGGVAEAVALFMLESGIHAPFKALCIPQTFPQRCLGRSELLAAAGIDASRIRGAFLDLWTKAGTNQISCYNHTRQCK